MRAWVLAMVLVGGCAKPHVNLGPLPPTATPEERMQIFSSLRAVGEETQYTTTCRQGGGCSTSVDKTLHLANGAQVHHPEDLLPVVADDSPTARSVRAIRTARDKQLRYGLIALGSFVGLVVVGFHGISTSDYGGVSAGHKLLMVAAGVGIIVGGVGAYKYHFQAIGHWADANEQFNQSLAQRLNICVSGVAIVPCEGGAPGVAVPAAPDPALRSLRQK